MVEFPVERVGVWKEGTEQWRGREAGLDLDVL